MRPVRHTCPPITKADLAIRDVVQEMAAVMPPALTPVMPWGPTIDGTSLLELPLKSLRAGKFNKVRLYHTAHALSSACSA